MQSPSPLDATLDRWIAHFRGPLVGLLATWGADWQVAEELAMDTFAEAWLGRERMRAAAEDLEAVGAWLRGIAHNLQLAHRRRQPRTLELVGNEAAPIDAGDDDATLALREGFAQLRPEHQEVLRMHYLEETTARDVAALLDVTPKAVEMRLYQARRALRHLADKHLRTTTGAER